MQAGPPSSRDEANSSVTGSRNAPCEVRQSGVSTIAVGGTLTSTARLPLAETETICTVTDAGPVRAGTSRPTTR